MSGEVTTTFCFPGQNHSYEVSHSETTDFSSSLGFQSYQPFTPAAINFPQAALPGNSYSTPEVKLESFSELLESRYGEVSAESTTRSQEQVATKAEASTDLVKVETETSQDKPLQAADDVQSENFGEIIKKTMVESVTA